MNRGKNNRGTHTIIREVRKKTPTTPNSRRRPITVSNFRPRKLINCVN